MMLVAALCLGFTSCSDDDDDDNVVTGEGIVGTWQLTNVENHYYSGEVETFDFLPYENTYALFMKYNSNGTGTTYENEEGEWWSGDFHYTFDGNTIVGTDEDGTTTLEVLSLTKTTMVIKGKDTDDNGVDYMIQTFKRVSDDKVKNAK